MKVIIVYSGKGGVGKTTVTAALAKELAKHGKVAVLDADVATPSMSVLFPNPDEAPFKIYSTGYIYHSDIILPLQEVSRFFRKSFRDAKENKVDYFVVDTPPSLMEIHLAMVKTLKPSGFVIVTMDDDLAKADVSRTLLFFSKIGARLLATVSNMSNNGGVNTIVIPRLENPLRDMGKYLDIVVKKVINSDEGDVYPDENVSSMVDVMLNAEGDCHATEFTTVKAWDDARDNIEGKHLFGIDEGLLRTDADTIRKLLEAFKESSTAYFMVTRPPITEKILFPGEIGICRLKEHTNMYGTPGVIYMTEDAEVTLYAHEVMPADDELVKYMMETGIQVGNGRIVPRPQDIQDIKNNFPSLLVGKWEEEYQRLVKLEAAKI